MPSPLVVISRTLVTAAAMILLALGTAPPATAEGCPNATLRAQNNSSELPDCRAYEMVTPPYKQGFVLEDLNGQTFLDDGSALSFVSTGNLAGAQSGLVGGQYVARRGSAGWTTKSLDPPASFLGFSLFGAQDGLGVAADLQSSLWQLKTRPDESFNYYLRDSDGAFTFVGDGGVPDVPIEPNSPGAISGGAPDTLGASADLSHVVFNHNPGVTETHSALYEFVGTGNAGLPRPVSVDNSGQRLSGSLCFQDMSGDGRVIVVADGCRGTGIPQLWARVGGSATVSVSGSECTRPSDDPAGGCNATKRADYAGAARDGSRVLFSTDQQLVNGDVDQSTDLYACDIPAGAPAPVEAANPCTSLRQVSAGSAAGARVEQVPDRDDNGQNVLRVVAVSDDGSKVYFVAQGVLADNLGTNGAAAVDGDHNLYLWSTDATHPAGQTRFVARLDANDLGGDSSRQMTPDGRYLTFTTASALVTDGPGADGDSSRDIYRYDVQTHSVVRLSTTVAGGGGDGAFDVTGSMRAGRRSATGMTVDGSTVVFVTGEALSTADTNGERDVYAWHDGQVSLISRGGGYAPWITPSGRDIFFRTRERLTATDGDVNDDIYDARVGGGFDLARPARCAGDGCQGPVSGPPAVARPGSSGSGGGNVDAGVRPAIGGIAKLSASDRTILARGGKARLRLRVNRPGLVTVAGTASVRRKSRRVVSASAIAKRAGRVIVRFGLSRGARAELGRRGSLTIGLTVRLREARPKTLTVTLRAVKPKSGKGGSR